jgi:opacity protein-like surface antigen
MGGRHDAAHLVAGDLADNFDLEIGLMIASKRALLHATVSASAIAVGLLWATPSAGADALQDIFGANPYISVFGGGNIARGNTNYLDDVFDVRLNTGFTVGAAVGSSIGHGLRFERELSYQHNTNDKTRSFAAGNFFDISGDTEAVFLLANLWKDIDIGMGSVYMGGGIGTAFIDSNTELGGGGWNDSGIALAAQLGAGLRIPVSDRLALDLGYRLKGAMDAPFDRHENVLNAAMTVYSHTAQLGLSYALGEGSQIMPVADIDASAPSWYISVFGGGAVPEDVALDLGLVYAIEGKTGFTLGAAAGTHLAPGLRGELELSYLRHAVDGYTFLGGQATGDASGDMEQTFLLANIWKDFQLGVFSPYVGGGIGFGTTRFDNVTFGGSTVGDKAGLGLAGQLGAGVRFGITDNLAADMGYRFKSTVNALVEGDPSSDASNASVATYDHVFQLGLTYGFGEGVEVASAPPLEGKYVSLFGGGVVPADTHISQDNQSYIVDFNTGFTVGAAVGATIADHVRGEIELSHLRYKPDTTDNAGSVTDASGRMNMTFLMANVWRDVDLGAFQPYGGFGVGMALANVDIALGGGTVTHINDTSLALAAQAGTGVRLPINDALTVDVGYRFKAALDVLTKGDTSGGDAHGSGSHYAHVGQVGVTWKF